MRYLAELYLPRAERDRASQIAARARAAAEALAHEGAECGTALHLRARGRDVRPAVRRSSPEIVREASRRAGLECDRVLEAIEPQAAPATEGGSLMRARALLCVAALPAGAGSVWGRGRRIRARGATSKPPEPATVLKITDTSTPGDWSFDKKRLTAKAGKVTIELPQPVRPRSQRARPDRQEVLLRRATPRTSGARRSSAGRSAARQDERSATLDLKAGKYWFLCANPGHWQAGQRGPS